MTVLFTDGFESNDFSAWDKASGSNGGSVSTGTDYKYAGSYGACLYGHGVGGTAEIHLEKDVSSSTEFWHSFWFKPVSCDYPDGTLRVMLQVRNASTTAFRLAFGTVGANKRFNMGYRSDGGDWTVLDVSDLNVSLGTWYFIEFHTKIGAGDGEAALFVDGVERASVSGISNSSYSGIEKYRHYLAATTTETMERHLDDATISTERI